jgi:glycerol-3-phosphate dehydrogenase (NAD(P)+)
MKIAVLGAGAWGTALAQVLAKNGHETILWTWLKEHADAMEAARENQEFLPGVALDETLGLSSSLADACGRAELIVVVVPSQVVRSTLMAARPYLLSGVNIACASKGIEEGTLCLMTDVIAECVKNDGEDVAAVMDRIGVVSGPSFAKEVAHQVPTNLVSASTNPSLATLLQKTLSTPWLRVYTSSDPVGVEVGGALKNVIAIAAGACDGFGLGQNTRAALITRGIAEMSRLATALGGQALTTAGLAGVGDLVLTCTGDLSRNRTLGFKLGRGTPLSEALRTSAGVAEGYLTTKSAHDLARRVGVDLPICESVYDVLYEAKEPKEVLRGLLSRPLRPELE